MSWVAMTAHVDHSNGSTSTFHWHCHFYMLLDLPFRLHPCHCGHFLFLLHHTWRDSPISPRPSTRRVEPSSISYDPPSSSLSPDRAASVQEFQDPNMAEEKEGTVIKSYEEEAVHQFAEAKDICNGNGKIAPLEDETKDEVAKDPAAETLAVNNIQKLDAPNSVSPLIEEAEKPSENPMLSGNVETAPVVVETIDEVAKEPVLPMSAVDDIEGKSDAPNSSTEEAGEPSEKPMSSENGEIVPLVVEMKDEAKEPASETPVVNSSEENSDAPESVIPLVEVVEKPSEKLMSSEYGETVPLVAEMKCEVAKEPATDTQAVNYIEENPDAPNIVNPLVEAAEKLSENSMSSDSGETAQLVEETMYVVAKELDHETPVSCAEEKLSVPNSINPLVEAVEKPMSSGSGETTPLVVETKDEVANESVLETPFVNGPEEKSDVTNFVKISDDEEVENHSEKPNTNEMEPSNPLNGDETGGSNLVQSVGEQLQIREEENKSIAPMESEMEVEKYVDIPSTDLTMLGSEVVEDPTDDNLESLPAAKLLRDLLGFPEVLIDTTTSEADSLPADEPTSNLMDNELKELESKSIDIPEIPTEIVSEAPKVAVEAIEIPQRYDEVSDGKIVAAEAVPSQIEAGTCAAVESIDDDTSKVVNEVDRSIEVKSPVHSEEASSQTIQVEKLPKETEKHDSTLDTISGLPEASYTDDIISEVEDPVNDLNEACHVSPLVTVSAQDVIEKVEREDPPCDLNEVTSPIEVPTKEKVADSATAPSVTLEAETTVVSEVTNVSEVCETLGNQSEVHTPSVPAESVVKEGVENSGDVREAVQVFVTDIVNIIEPPEHVTQTTVCEAVEVVPVEEIDISKTVEERAIQTSHLVDDDENKIGDIAESVVETIVKEVDEGNVVANVAEKLVDEKRKELNEAAEGTETVNESIVCDSRKTDEKNDDSIESHGRDLAEDLKNTTDRKPETEATKQVVLTKTRSPNMISKVKHSLVKAKKAIFGKSHSSKAISTESNGNRKA